MKEVADTKKEDAGEQTLLQEKSLLALESSLAFLDVSKKAARRMSPEYRLSVMKKLVSLEEEGQGLAERHDAEGIQAFSKKVGELGRDILTLSNL